MGDGDRRTIRCDAILFFMKVKVKVSVGRSVEGPPFFLPLLPFPSLHPFYTSIPIQSIRSYAIRVQSSAVGRSSL